MEDHFLQSKTWRECKESLGNKTFSVGRYFFQRTKIPFINKYLGYMPRVNLEHLDWKRLEKKAKSAGLVYLTIDPLNISDDLEFRPGSSKNFRVSKGIPVHKQKTLLIDLEKEEHELLKDMKRKTRYNVRLSEKKGITFVIGDGEKDFMTFMDLYNRTVNRQGYVSRKPAYVIKVWEKIKQQKGGPAFHGDNLVSQVKRDGENEVIKKGPQIAGANGQSGGGIAANNQLELDAKIATVFYEGKALASWMIFLYGDTIYYPYGGSSEEHKNVMAAYGLVWNVIKWGKKNGFKYFDLFGIEDDERKGYTRFKLGFGGKVVKYVDTIDLILQPGLYTFLKFLYRIRERFIFLKKLS